MFIDLGYFLDNYGFVLLGFVFWGVYFLFYIDFVVWFFFDDWGISGYFLGRLIGVFCGVYDYFLFWLILIIGVFNGGFLN